MKPVLIKEGKELRVKTDAGLDIRTYNNSLDVELERMPFGVSIALVDARSPSEAAAPAGAYYRISFYKPDTAVGGNGKVNEVKLNLPGAVYLSREGVVIRGSQPVAERFRESFIDYKER